MKIGLSSFSILPAPLPVLVGNNLLLPLTPNLKRFKSNFHSDISLQAGNEKYACVPRAVSKNANIECYWADFEAADESWASPDLQCWAANEDAVGATHPPNPRSTQPTQFNVNDPTQIWVWEKPKQSI